MDEHYGEEHEGSPVVGRRRRFLDLSPLWQRRSDRFHRQRSTAPARLAKERRLELEQSPEASTPTEVEARRGNAS
jgi:hypothetical protein